MIQNGLEIRAVVTGVIRHPLRGQAETAARKMLRKLIASTEHRAGGHGAAGENAVAGSEREIDIEDFVPPGQQLLQKLQDVGKETVCDRVIRIIGFRESSSRDSLMGGFQRGAHSSGILNIRGDVKTAIDTGKNQIRFLRKEISQADAHTV